VKCCKFSLTKPFIRTCNFYLKDGVGELKEASVHLMQMFENKDKDIEIGFAKINLADYIGDDWA
jgi:hypothetical protein